MNSLVASSLAVRPLAPLRARRSTRAARPTPLSPTVLAVGPKNHPQPQQPQQSAPNVSNKRGAAATGRGVIEHSTDVKSLLPPPRGHGLYRQSL